MESNGMSKDLTVGVRVVSVGTRRRRARKKRGLDGGLTGHTAELTRWSLINQDLLQSGRKGGIIW